ncbi:hypothetical protein [Bizionia arctica]|uniref:Outer membrane protein beta-barrel domain-containing protein n=1 Tax=Bizionia arctica TaxID=1495645 RepID=A0A917LVV8_9FLAO|nr:hypothetical protein [Bizionia arctica]GGG60046.1 hypothetical protein GCM10010976_33490 [Bizionia arctica]
MNKLALSICLLISTYGFSQYGAVTDVPWTISAGINVVDNDGFQFDKPFDTGNWNFKNPFTIGAERRFSELLAANVSLTLNGLESSNLQNGGYLSKDETLFAIDATAKFYYDQLFMPTYQLNWFQGYLISGLGYTSVASYNTATFDFGFGFQFWLENNIGFRIQTMGKWGFNEWIYLKNYIQNSAEVIYRF